MREMMEAIKPTLVAHFKPALLARMTMVPYLPISHGGPRRDHPPQARRRHHRLRNNQRVEGTYSDGMVKHIADQCTQVDTGARNIDHILRATLLPQMSVAILERIATTGLPKKMKPRRQRREELHHRVQRLGSVTMGLRPSVTYPRGGASPRRASC